MPARLIDTASFNPETTRLLGVAYERASEGIASENTIRETIAKRDHRRGERDIEKLVGCGLGRNDPQPKTAFKLT